MLAHKVASGALWLVGARLATRVLDLVSMLVVARLLVPADFGLFALAAGLLLILNAVTDLSLANAIIQMRDPPEAIYDTAFTLEALRGLALGALIAAAALPFASVYGDERLAPILFSLAAVPVVRALASPRMAGLQRALQFRPAFYLEASGKLAAFVAAVAVAVLTRSYWALVAGMIAAPAISTLLSYGLAPYRPAFSLRDWRPIFAFSGWLTLSNTVNTLNWQADRFLIGGHLGTAVLGQYTVGSELASLPTNAPIMPIMQALYAGFARLSHDPARLSAAYLMSQCIVMALALPIAITVSFFAHPIIRFAVGPEWAASAFVVQVLAPVFAVQMLTAPAQSIAMITGRTRSIFGRDIVSLAVRLPLIFVGLAVAGFSGVVWARVASGLFIIVLNLVLVQGILGVPILRQVLAPWRSFASAAAMAGFLWWCRSRIEAAAALDLSVLAELAGIASAGFAVYGAVHLLLWSFTRPENSAEGRLLRMARHAILKTQKA